MSTIAVIIIFVIRMILPLGLLIGLGEWMRRREQKYWLRK